MDYKKVLELKKRELEQEEKLKRLREELQENAKLLKQWNDYLIATYGTDDSNSLSLRYRNQVGHEVYKDLGSRRKVKDRIEFLKREIEVESVDIELIDEIVSGIY